ncbi:cytochrome C [Pseudomonas syringae]|nr:cytochrome C [Pseudomonas syringae]MCF5071005.1 cytochrome C [Pseudomonas syringae]
MNTLANKLMKAVAVLHVPRTALNVGGYLSTCLYACCKCACGRIIPAVPSSMLAEMNPVDFPVGAHLMTPRPFYVHHGIYLGRGKVAHYSGFSGSFTAGPVEVTTVGQFANGKPVWLKEEFGEYSNEDIALRARSRIGESQYRIFSNNCEHFCSWCINGTSCSAQVRSLVYYPCYLFLLIWVLDLTVFA